jgi:hypothetical protein
MSTPDAALVTGYVRLDSPHRPHAEYARLGRELLDCHSPAVAFLDGIDHPTATVRPASLESCWLWHVARDAALPPGNASKDTAAYHAVQHQKTAWLAAAADHTAAELLVWVDFGVLHIPSVTREAVAAFFSRVPRAPRDRITLASIWPIDGSSVVDCSRVNWYVAGGVAIVPRHLAAQWHELVVDTACQYHAYTGAVTWEVNIWARVAQSRPSLFAFYASDHDASLFDGLAP